MPTYSELNQRHPSCNEERREELCALYEGGEKLEKLYPRLLPRRDREGDKRYQLRLKEAQYRNYLGPIVDYFASMLFVSRTVSKAKRENKAVEDPGEYWTLFREDCDRGGTDLDDLFKQVLTSAMVERTAWLRLHLPIDGGPEPENRADFDARKLGDAWIEKLDGAEVLDWDLGDDGRLLWAVVHSREQLRNGLTSKRNTVVETWDYLTGDNVETYQLTWTTDKQPTPDQEVPRIGEPVRHGFARVPLVCLDLKPALWVASRLRSPQLAHFRKLNAQAWSLAATCYAVREFYVADVEGFTKQVQGPGYELILGKDDKTAWSAPPGEHFAALDIEIKAEKDEIFRIAHQMALGVENNAAAIGRSAESKASDLESTRVVLVAFSRAVRECIEYTLDLISAARGDQFEWSVEGLDDFAALDAQAFVENLKLLSEANVTIPSKTFQIAINERTAELLLPHLDEETKTKVREEIQAGTTDPAEDAEREREAASALFAARQATPPNGTERTRETPPAPAS